MYNKFHPRLVRRIKAPNYFEILKNFRIFVFIY